MTEIVIRLDVPETAVPDFAPIVHQVVEALGPVVHQVGGTGEVLIDGQPLESYGAELGCQHPKIELEERYSSGEQFEMFNYRCTACEYTVLLGRLYGEEPTEDEVRQTFRAEPTDTEGADKP